MDKYILYNYNDMVYTITSHAGASYPGYYSNSIHGNIDLFTNLLVNFIFKLLGNVYLAMNFLAILSIVLAFISSYLFIYNINKNKAYSAIFSLFYALGNPLLYRKLS